MQPELSEQLVSQEEEGETHRAGAETMKALERQKLNEQALKTDKVDREGPHKQREQKAPTALRRKQPAKHAGTMLPTEP